MHRVCCIMHKATRPTPEDTIPTRLQHYTIGQRIGDGVQAVMCCAMMLLTCIKACIARCCCRRNCLQLIASAVGGQCQVFVGRHVDTG